MSVVASFMPVGLNAKAHVRDNRHHRSANEERHADLDDTWTEPPDAALWGGWDRSTFHERTTFRYGR